MKNNRMTNIEQAKDALFSLSSDISREEWIQTGMAAHAAGLDIDDFLLWSSKSARYVERDARAAWTSFKSGKGIGVGTLIKKARESGWTPSHTTSGLTTKTTKTHSLRDKTNSVARIWEQCESLGEFDSHPYVERKNGVKTGLKVVPDHFPLVNAGVPVSGALVVPICPLGSDEPTSLQFIADGELAKEWGAQGRPSKLNLQGSALDGVYVVGELQESGTVYVTEGIGQAWSCWKATGHASVVSFGWGRVRKVIQNLKDKYADLRIVIVPDAGLEKEAAKISEEYRVSYVQMPDGWPRNSDVNDLARRHGIEALEDLLVDLRLGVGSKKEYPLDIVYGSELPKKFVPPDELVEGLLVQGDISMVFGDSNSGKTFLMLDMAAAISRGVEWLGRKTEQGLVVYLATESPSSVRMRLQGYQLHNGVDLNNFAIVQTPVNLFDSDVDTNRIIETVKLIEAKRGEKVRLIVGDTLARLCEGANENSGQDMGPVMGRVDRIRAGCESAVVLIHHVGKNAALGARGWSGVRAAIDTELEVFVESIARCLEVKKQRDLGTRGLRIGFELNPIFLGYSKWGASVTTCVVSAADAPSSVPSKRVGEIGGAIVEYLSGQSAGKKKSEIVKHLSGRHDDSAVYREIKKLVNSGRLTECIGIVSLVTDSARVATE